MKYIFALLFFALGFSTTAFSQKRRKTIPEPPKITDKVPATGSENGNSIPPENYIMPPVPVNSPRAAGETNGASCERLWNDKKSWPLVFVYKVDTDTVILPGQLFKKELKISAAGVQLLTSFATENMRLVSSRKRITAADYHYAEGADTIVQISEAELAQLKRERKETLPAPPRVESAFFKVKMVADTAVLTNIKTGEVEKYQLYTDLQKTKITEIWDLSGKRMYKPASL